MFFKTLSSGGGVNCNTSYHQASTQVLWPIYQHFCELSNFKFNLHGMHAALGH
jgi:hypothetical protein